MFSVLLCSTNNSMSLKRFMSIVSRESFRSILLSLAHQSNQELWINLETSVLLEFRRFVNNTGLEELEIWGPSWPLWQRNTNLKSRLCNFIIEFAVSSKSLEIMFKIWTWSTRLLKRCLRAIISNRLLRSWCPKIRSSRQNTELFQKKLEHGWFKGISDNVPICTFINLKPGGMLFIIWL